MKIGLGHNGTVPSPLRVLVIDDERPLVGVITSYLEREGFEVTAAHDGLSAVAMAQAERPDLILLDVMLPGIDGIEVCRRIREFTSAYVIMLTARDGEAETVRGLSAGADDYVLKPFSPRELVARIHAMLRRPRGAGSAESEIIRIGDISLDPAARRVTVASRSVDLTRIEFDVLAELAARPQAAHSRRSIIDAVWGEDWIGDEHIVDVHVGHLRRKLGDDASRPRYVRTVRGVGYGLGPA